MKPKISKKRLQERAGGRLALIQKHTSREEAEEVFPSIKEKKSIAETINAEFARKLEKRLHLDPLLRYWKKKLLTQTWPIIWKGVVASLKVKMFKGQAHGARRLWMRL